MISHHQILLWVMHSVRICSAAIFDEQAEKTSPQFPGDSAFQEEMAGSCRRVFSFGLQQVGSRSEG